MNKPVVILNAPPNAGKDVIAKEIQSLTGLPHLEFKEKLFELACVISGLDRDQLDSLYTRERKETPCNLLFGMTPRNFLIDISERMIKPKCGSDYFGNHLGAKARKDGAVVSDGGFNREVEAVIRQVGAENVYVVRFTREGCSFEGDSRNFIDSNQVKHYLDLENNGTIQEIATKIVNWVTSNLVDS